MNPTAARPHDVRIGATISHALNGRRIHPATLRAINAVLRAVAPLEDVEALVAREDAVILGESVHWGSQPRALRHARNAQLEADNAQPREAGGVGVTTSTRACSDQT